MESLKKIIYILTIGIFILSACDNDGLPIPDGTKHGVIATVNFTANSETRLNIAADPSTTIYELVIEVADGNYERLEAKVVLNNDFVNQYTIQEVTSGETISFDVNDLVSIIDELNSSDDIQVGDIFTFFVNVYLSDGTLLPAFLSTGEWAYDPNIRNNPNYNLSVFIDSWQYCPYDPASEIAGTWTGTDFDAPSNLVVTDIITTAPDVFSITGLGFDALLLGWWGETVTASVPVSMTLNTDGTLNIPRQHYCTTDYLGDPYDYEIEGSGTWFNCGPTPSFTIYYDLYYPGDAVGIVAGYAGLPYATATIVRD